MSVAELVHLTPSAGPSGPQLDRDLAAVLSDHARAINALAAGRLAAVDAVSAAAPTAGTWAKGDIVRASAPALTGTLALLGWLRLTSGSGNVLGTDWVPIAPNGSTTTLTVSDDGAVVTANTTVNTSSAGFRVTNGSSETASFKSDPNSGELKVVAGFGGYGGFQTFWTNGVQRMRIEVAGDIVSLPTATPPTLANNGEMVMNVTSNTNLRISVRGSDGVTRVANITLA